LDPSVIDSSIETSLQTMAQEIPKFWTSLSASSHMQCGCIENAIYDHKAWFSNASIVLKQGTTTSGKEMEQQMRLVSIRSSLPCRLLADSPAAVFQYTSSECTTTDSDVECATGSTSVGPLHSTTQFLSIEDVSNNFFGERVGEKISFLRSDGTHFIQTMLERDISVEVSAFLNRLLIA
jgi:hypothetical protein